ncbi:CcmD family protein [Parapedobacter lycopersici]|uniref:CcmD family protein n=1 Tax=Parapedobacter lycopersici TaxID=1864939 RepID=UPI00333FFF33
MKKIILSFLLVINGLICSFAQTNAEVEMATDFRSSGKIYVVILVLAIILIGLAVYLFTIDRKITRLEKSRKA